MDGSRRGRNFFIHILFLVLSAGLSLFLSVYIQLSRFTIVDHKLHLSPLLFGAFLVFFFLFLTAGWIALSKLEAKKFGMDASDRLREGALASLPLIFFLLSPLLLEHYITRHDLRIRLILLAAFIVLAVFYLKLAGLGSFFKEHPSFIEKRLARFGSLSLKKKLVLLFFVAFLVYNACTLILVSQGITFSGDEPNYLLTTHSLLYDKDINLANNYANRDYFHFYSREDNPRLKLAVYGRYGKKGKQYIYPINLPGISVLMLPWYWLSQFFTGKGLTFILKGSLSLWAVLLGLQVYLLARDLWRRESLAFMLWLFYSFSAPVLFYAAHLYPEIPIALFSVYVFRQVTSGGPLSSLRLLFLGFLLGTFFWFGLKYNFIFWPLLLVCLYFLWKHQRPRSKILLFLIFPIFSTALFYFFVYGLYGTFSPFAVYDGVLTPEKSQALKEAVIGLPLLARIEAFFDYFLDQRDGLFLYAPVYFFMLLGLVEMFRRAKRELFILLFITLPFILNYAFFSHRQGYCPQGRVLASISWVAIIFIGYFLAFNRNKFFSFLFWLAGAAGFIIAGLLLRHPMFLYQPTTHDYTQRAGDLFVFLGNMHFFLPSFLPSFIKVNNVGYWPNYFWISVVLVFAAAYILFNKQGRKPLRMGFHLAAAGILLSASVFLWVLYPRDVLYPAQTFNLASKKALGFYLLPMGRGVVAKNDAELYLHFEKTYKILFSAKRPLQNIKLVFGSDKGEHEVRMTFFDLPLYEGKTRFEKKERIFAPPAFYRFRNLYLYEIDLTLKKHSTENLLINPYLLQIAPILN
jgi:hypothetical protein